MSRPQFLSHNVIAWATLLILGLAWGSTIPFTKIAVSSGHQSFGLIFWQLVIGVMSLGPILILRRWRPVLSREKLIFYTTIAIIGTIIPNGFSYLAAAQLPAGVMAIAIATVPMFAIAIALVLRLEAFDPLRMLGVLVGFIAMVLITAPETSLPDPDKAVFVLIALLAPLCYGMESNYLAKFTPSETDPISTLFMASFLGLIIVAPLAVVSGQFIDPFRPFQAPEYALIASSLVHAATYVGFIWLVSFGGPVFSVQIAYPVTLSGVFISVVFLGEAYSGWIWTALVLVIIALFLVQPKLGNQIVEEPQ